MATCQLQHDSEGYAIFPPNTTLEEAKRILKPPGILSNGFTQGLKKVEQRPFVPAKESKFTDSCGVMRQTNYREPVEEPSEQNYYLVKTQRSTARVYDRLNSVTEGYDQKLHRDDRQHAKLRGLKTNEEECQRAVPMTHNAIYGHPNRVKLERNMKDHSHRELCKEDFNSRNGINFGSSED